MVSDISPISVKNPSLRSKPSVFHRYFFMEKQILNGRNLVVNQLKILMRWMMLHAKLLQLCPTFCNSIDCSQPGSSVHGILQAKILERLPFPPPGDLPDLGIKPGSPALVSGFFTASATWESHG